MTALNAQSLGEIDPRVPGPSYDRDAVTCGIVHQGVGGFHRAHEAMYVDALLHEGGVTDWGITGVGLLPPDRAMLDRASRDRHRDCRATPRHRR